MRGWYPLIEFLVRQDRPRAVLWLTGAGAEEWRGEVAALCQETGAELVQGESPRDLPALKTLDLVLLEGNPDWFSTFSRLRWLARWSRASEDRRLPTTLVSDIGWPYGRRDGYREPSSIPRRYVQPHRRGGLVPSEPEPVAGRGFEPGRYHALLAHPFRSGRLTALEDFLRRQPPSLRLLKLPGFHGLGVIAPEDRIGRSAAIRRLFEDPGGLLLEVGHLAALEEARLEALAAGQAPAPKAPEAREAGPLVERAVRAERLLTAERSEVRRLAAALLEVRGNVLDLLGSRRWRLGSRLGDLYLKIHRRGKTESAAERLSQLLAEMEGWGLGKKVRRQTLDEPLPPREGGGSETVGDVAEAEPGPGLFRRTVAAVAPGALEERFLAAWRRTEEWVEQARSHPAHAQPLVSVIMATRKRAHVIGQAVTSVLEQTYENWELIICEDGASPGTKEVVDQLRDPRIRYLAIPRVGAAGARNRALESARGKVIAYLDDDNLWHPAFLETLVGLLERRPAYPAVFCRYLGVEVRGNRSILHSLEPSRFDYESLCRMNSIDLNTLVHRRELYDLFGGFDENLARHQDWDLVLRYGFAADLMPADALLTLYRRNRKWGQISFAENSARSWERVRTRVQQLYETGGPEPVRERFRDPVTLVFDPEGRGTWARAEALGRALGGRRKVHLVAMGRQAGGAPAEAPGELEVEVLRDSDPSRLAEVCGDGLVYLIDPSARSLELARAASAAAGCTLLVERDLGAALDDREGPIVGESPLGGQEIGLVQALSPEPVPESLRVAPPVSLATIGGDRERGAGAAADSGEPDLTLLLVGHGGELDEIAAFEAELRTEGLRVARADLSDPSLQTATEICRRVLSASALLVVPERGREAVGSQARQAIVEAFAAHVPVIAVPCVELSWLGGDGCLALAGGGPREVAATVKELLQDHAFTSRLTTRAWRLACRRYSPSAAANAFDLLVAGLSLKAAGSSGSSESTPRLSVVVPTRDTRELTLRCLRSLFANAIPGMEVILVDDGSVDDTAAAVLQAYPVVRVVGNPQPSGFTLSANRGLAAAEGQIVLLLNSDTEVGEGALAALLEAFEDQRLGVAGAQLSYPDGRDQWSGGPEPGLMWLFLQSSGWAALLARRSLVRRIRRALGTGARQVAWVTGAALAVRRPALTEVGPLDERFSFYAQDLDFCLRAKAAGWSVRIVPDFRILHRHGYSIARLEETVAGQQLETLWRDLLRWAEKRRGPAWAHRARQALLWGARFRVLGRVLVSPIMRPLKGLAWRRNTAACRQALVALERGGSAGGVAG